MDREKVIYDIERCICHVPDACRDCSHYGHGEVIGCMEELLTDVLALLKEQETTIKAQQFVLNNACEKLKEKKIAMKPKNKDKVGGNCPVCGLRMARNDKYCSQCGQEMDWEC